jgi:hypothetical protein
MSRELSPSFLGLEGLHVFVTGAAGGIGQRAVQEFLGRCRSIVLLLQVYTCLCKLEIDKPTMLDWNAIVCNAR